jgi:uncharacterized protein YecA (UPF0149 family)
MSRRKIAEARDTPTVQVLDQPVPADKQIVRGWCSIAVAGLLGAWSCDHPGLWAGGARQKKCRSRQVSIPPKLTIFQSQW